MLNLTIIDDDRDFTKTLSVYLTKHFPQIKIFQPISETNTIKLAIKNFHTDIVIADVKNPIVNGVEIVKNFKKEKPNHCSLETKQKSDHWLSNSNFYQ